MIFGKIEIINAMHAENLAKASPEQIELARIFQRAAFDDGVQDGNSTRAEMAECPDTFIPAPLYLDLALKFSDAEWRAKLNLALLNAALPLGGPLVG